MTFVEKRNALVLALSEYVGRPVLLANQVQPEEDPPFIVWEILSDYTPDGSLGHAVVYCLQHHQVWSGRGREALLRPGG